jgi:hypothetical protein
MSSSSESPSSHRAQLENSRSSSECGLELVVGVAAAHPGTTRGEVRHSELVAASQPQLPVITPSFLIPQGWNKLPLEIQDEIFFHAIACHPRFLGRASTQQRCYTAMLSTVCRRWRQVLILPEWWTRLGNGQIKYLDEFLRRSQDRPLEIHMDLSVDVDAGDLSEMSSQLLDGALAIGSHSGCIRTVEQQAEILIKLLSVAARWHTVDLAVNAMLMTMTGLWETPPRFDKLKKFSIHLRYTSGELSRLQRTGRKSPNVAWPAPHLEYFKHLSFPLASFRLVERPTQSKLRELYLYTYSPQALFDIVACHSNLVTLITSDAVIPVDEMMNDFVQFPELSNQRRLGFKNTSASRCSQSPSLHTLHIRGNFVFRFLRRFLLNACYGGSPTLDHLRELKLCQDGDPFPLDPVDRLHTLAKDLIPFLPQSIQYLIFHRIDWRSFEDILDILQCLPGLTYLSFFEITVGKYNPALYDRGVRETLAARGQLVRSLFRSLAEVVESDLAFEDSKVRFKNFKLAPQLETLVLGVTYESFRMCREALLALVRDRSPLRTSNGAKAHTQAQAQPQVDQMADTSTADSYFSSHLSSSSSVGTLPLAVSEAPELVQGQCDMEEETRTLPRAGLRDVDISIGCHPVINIDSLKESLYKDLSSYVGPEQGMTIDVQYLGTVRL